MPTKSGVMASESPSSSWDERQHRHKKYRDRSPELNLSQSLNHVDEYEEDGRHQELERLPQQAGSLGDNHHEQQQFMDGDYDDGALRNRQNSKRQSKNGDYESSRLAVTGLDLNIGHSSPEVPRPPSSSGKMLLLIPGMHSSPKSRHALPSPPLPLPPSRRDRSPLPSSRSPPAGAAVGQSTKSTPPSFSHRRLSSHRKQYSSPPPSGGRRSQHSPVISRQQQQQLGSSPPSKRAFLLTRQRSPPLVEERQQRQEQLRQRTPSPVRRQDPSTEPAVGRRRSPYVAEERRLPARRWSSPVIEERQQEQQRQYSPLVRRRDPSPQPGRKAAAAAASPEPGRRQSATLSGERRRQPMEDGPEKRGRSRAPVHYRNQSRSRSSMPRRSSSPVPTFRRTRSPVVRRRSPRRSPRRERSPGRRGSPRRGSSPSRYRGSRRDWQSSPAGRTGWSPVQDRSHGVRKPENSLFIAGFNFVTTETDLERKFSRYGRVMDVRIVRDERSGKSQGCGFLTLERDEDADAAIRALDQTDWHGRIVLVEKAKTPTCSLYDLT